MKRFAPVALALLASAAGHGATVEEAHTRFRAMGTVIDVRVRAGDPDAARRGLDRTRALFERLHREWYPWRRDSTLARINRRLREGEAAQAPLDLIRLLRRARRLERASGGRFNAAMGGLVELWGFHEPPPYDDPAPAAAEVRRWARAQPSLADMDFGGGRIASDNPAVRIDLGGIGKGAAVDRARRRIRHTGADTALVNAGGDLAALGQRDGRPWRVGLRAPEGGVLAHMALRAGEAVFTSGDYARFRETDTGDSERAGHVLDPRTGFPAEGAVQATAVARSATRADAAATALLVAGAEHWWRVARALRLRHALIVDAEGRIHMNRALARRLTVTGDRPADKVVRALY